MWLSRIAALQMITACVGCWLLIERQTSTPLRMGRLRSSKTRSNGPRAAKNSTPSDPSAASTTSYPSAQKLGDQAAKDMLVLNQQELPCPYCTHGLLLIPRGSILVPHPISAWQRAVAATSGSAA